ncbi:major facilitator superfamily domain-containing protein 6-like [Antedon mediterranea]|uniref:major facilitator superfamily domain-containing protein 6-like n=1 Tax=Antedon mediterranea TaxID=105859 RepID=UPI003AF69C7F
MKVEINRTFLPIKAVYFLYLSGMACLNPYLPVYMIALGLSTSQIGLIRGLEPAVQLLVSPLCGLLSDKYSCHKIILLIALSGSAIFYFLTIFVPPVPVLYANVTATGNLSFQDCNKEFFKQLLNEESNAAYSNDTNIRNSTFNNTSSNCNCDFLEDLLPTRQYSSVFNTSGLTKKIMCNNNTTDICIHYCCKVNQTFTNSICNEQNTTSNLTLGSSTLTFVIMFCLIMTGQVFMCNNFPLVDMAVVELLQDRGDYGKQRLWGAVGWGSFAIIMGFILDKNHATSIKAKYLPAHLSFFVLVFGSVLAAIKMTFPPHRRPNSCFKNIYNVLCQAEILIFLLVVIVMGMCFGITSTFLFVYINDLNGDHMLMGLTLVTTCLSEIPFLYFSGRLIDFLGHQNVIYLTLLCYSLRFLGYSLVRNPYLVLIVEPLHGVTFGAFWAAMRMYASIISPPGMAATLQSFISTVDVGIGRGVGTIIGGVIYYNYGGRFLFRCCTILCLATAVVYFVSRYLIVRTCPITDYRLFQDEEDATIEQQLEEIEPQASPEGLPVTLKSRKSMRLVLHSINKPADCPLDDGSDMARIMQGVPPVLPSHGPSGASVCVQTSGRGMSTASSSCSSFVERWPHLPNLGEDEEEFQSKLSVVNVESYMPSPNSRPYEIVVKEHTV